MRLRNRETEAEERLDYHSPPGRPCGSTGAAAVGSSRAGALDSGSCRLHHADVCRRRCGSPQFEACPRHGAVENWVSRRPHCARPDGAPGSCTATEAFDRRRAVGWFRRLWAWAAGQRLPSVLGLTAKAIGTAACKPVPARLRIPAPHMDDLADIPAEKFPRHIAIIMDGNGRWAVQARAGTRPRASAGRAVRSRHRHRMRPAAQRARRAGLPHALLLQHRELEAAGQRGHVPHADVHRVPAQRARRP